MSAEPMDRAEAERILAAHGWTFVEWNDTSERARIETRVGHPLLLLPVEVLRALDPDRLPSLAALRRLSRGFAQIAGGSAATKAIVAGFQAFDSLANGEIELLLYGVWELGGKEPKP